MIPRHLAIIFAVLVLASLVMAGVLFHTLEAAHQQMLAGEDSAPTKAPAVAAPVQATLLVASDDDNSLRTQVYSLPLPADPESRARAILARLLDLYAEPGSSHSVPGGAASVAHVFLLPAESASKPAAATHTPGAPSAPGASPAKDSGAQMAVVNLKGSFVAGHPSGLETETLTVLSICGTLRANLPRVSEVRFLVDGQAHESLAGHADLTRTYLTSDIVPADGAVPAEPTHP